MTTKSIGFDIFARDRASDKFDKVGRSSSRAGDNLKKFAKYGALAAAAGAVAAGVALVGMAKAALADEKAQALLAKQLKNSAGATKAQVAATEDWISKQGIALGVTDDELRPALSKLVAVTKDVGKAQDLASLAMDVSAGTGKSLSTVSAALAKAQLGQVSGLSKLGVATKNADGSTKSLKEITEAMAATYKGSASTAANTAEGKFGRLKLLFDETKESIGSKLLPVLSDMATWFLAKGLPAFQRFGGWVSTTFGPIISKVVGWFKADLGPALQKVGDRVMPALKSAFESVKKALANAQPLFDLLGKVFVNILLPVLSKVASIVLPLLGKALEVVGKALGIAAGIVKKLASAFLLLGEFGIKAFRLLLTAAFATFEGILTAADKGLGWIPGIGSKIGDAKEAFSKFSDKTVDKLKRVEQKLHDTRDAVNGIPKSRTIDVRVKLTGPLAALGIGPSAPGPGQGAGVLAPGAQRTAGTLPRLAGRLLKPAGVTIMDGLIAGIEAGRAPLRSVLDKVTAFIGRQNDKIRDLIGKRSDLAAQFKGFTSSVFGADLGGDTGAAPTSGGLVAFQRAELAKAQRLKADVSKLVKMGLSKDLIQQLAASGETGIAQIHALASGSASDVTQLNSLNAQTQAALGAAGMSAGNAVFGSRIDQARAAQAQAIAIREELQKWRKQEDKNTVVEIHLSGRIIRMSLLELKRQNGGAPLGIA